MSYEKPELFTLAAAAVATRGQGEDTDSGNTGKSHTKAEADGGHPTDDSSDTGATSSTASAYEADE